MFYPTLIWSFAICAIGVHNLMHSILFLVLMFMASGVRLITLGMPFLGFIFIVLYVGAIAMLFLFIVTMVRPLYYGHSFWLYEHNHLATAGALGFSYLFANHVKESICRGPVSVGNAFHDNDIILIGQFLMEGEGWLPLLLLGVLLSLATFGAYLITYRVVHGDPTHFLHAKRS